MQNREEQLFNEMIEHQKEKLLHLGRRFVSNLTPEDMLQPNDYPLLENNPHFRYEEGVLAGLQSAQMALSALRAQLRHDHASSI